jgi:hypothetical protein
MGTANYRAKVTILSLVFGQIIPETGSLLGNIL